MNTRFACRLLLMAAIALAGWPPRATACDNPVFRYALQNWMSAEFELLLVKSAQLSADEAKAWDAIADAVDRNELKPNLRVRQVSPQEFSALRGEPVAGNSPEDNPQNFLALISPPGFAGSKQIWTGPCTAENAERILQSPARQELARRLLDGEAIVWIFVGSANDDADRVAMASLRTFFAGYSESVIAADAQAAAEAAARPKSPEFEPPTAPPADKAEFWPPRFSILEVDPTAAAEQVFLPMLKFTLEASTTSESTVFPVFGQGRVLGGMPVSQLSPARLRSACDFLTGACSCEVKEKNPGFDLLMSADWGSVAAKNSLDVLSLTSLDATEPRVGRQVAAPDESAAPDTTEEPKDLSQNRRGLAHFAVPWEQNVPVPLSADGFGIGPKRETSPPQPAELAAPPQILDGQSPEQKETIVAESTEVTSLPPHDNSNRRWWLVGSLILLTLLAAGFLLLQRVR